VETKKKYKLYRASKTITAMDYGSARLLTSEKYKFSMFYGMNSLPTEEEWIDEIKSYLRQYNKGFNDEQAISILTAHVSLMRAMADKINRDYCE
jgi:hypothetical protein